MNGMAIYLSAGFATTRNFMEEFGEKLYGVFENAGMRATVRTVFPYGDWSRSRWAQLAEIRRDLMPGRLRRRGPIGGARIVDTVQATASPGEPIVLIGHSAGGMASVHAAKLIFDADPGKPIHVVQIGSPKCPIPYALTESTLYLYAVGRRGKPTDPITRIGRWGPNVPGCVEGLHLIGGHADYFRSAPPFTDEVGQSNLDRTVRCVGTWLASGLHSLEPIS